MSKKMIIPKGSLRLSNIQVEHIANDLIVPYWKFKDESLCLCNSWGRG